MNVRKLPAPKLQKQFMKVSHKIAVAHKKIYPLQKQKYELASELSRRQKLGIRL